MVPNTTNVADELPTEQQVEKVQIINAAIMTAIDQNGGSEDFRVAIASLGAAMGIIALESGSPHECLDATIAVARGVVRDGLASQTPN